MKSLERILGVILILALSACIPSPLTVKTDFNPKTNFAGLKTYNWQDTPEGVIEFPGVEWKRLSSIVRDAADGELSEKGFVRKTTGRPDFLIYFHVTVDKQATSRQHMRGRYFDPYYKRERAAKVNVYQWDQGTVVLDFVDPKTQQKIWTGSATDQINLSESHEEKALRVYEAVREVLKGFPPK